MSYRMKVKDGAFYCESGIEHTRALEEAEKWGTVPKMEISNPVSENFRGYYFAGVVGFIHSIKMYPQLAKKPLNYRNEGVSLVDAYHELLKRDFNGIHIKVDEERTENMGRSVAVKNSKKFNSYIDRISEYTEDNYKIRVPTAEEYNLYRDKFMEEQTGIDFTKWFVQKKGQTAELLKR